MTQMAQSLLIKLHKISYKRMKNILKAQEMRTAVDISTVRYITV